MESKANYAVIGAFVLLTIIGMVAFIFYISGKQFDEEFDTYIVEFTTPPRGISVGSDVRFNGLKMGEVVKTKLDENDPNKVLVTIDVKKETPVHVDSFAQIEPLGLTGLSYIQLFAGKSGQRIDEQTLGSKIPHIIGHGSQIDNLLGGSESVLDNINVALSRASKAFTPEAIDDFHSILAHIDSITGRLSEADISGAKIDKLLGIIEQAGLDVSKASLETETAAKDISGFIKSEEMKAILSEIDQTLKTTNATLQEYQKLAKSSTALSDDALQTLEQFSTTGLQDLSVSMAELKALIETLNRISENLERNPAKFVAGEKREVTELPQ